MGPAQLATQCVANWIGLVKLSHIFEVGIVETLAVLRGQDGSKVFQEILAVSCTRFPFLFVLDDLTPDLPVSADKLD